MDIKTIISLLSIIYGIQVLVLALQFSVNRQYEGPGWWLLWSLSEAIGFLFLYFRDQNNLVLIFLQNAFLFYGTLFLYMGVRKFSGRKLSRPLFWTVFIFYTLLLTVFSTVYDSVAARGGLVYLSVGILSAFTAFSLFTERPASIRFTANFTAVIFTLHTLILLPTGIFKLAGLTPAHPLLNTPFNFIIFFDAMLISLLVTFGFILMMNQRLNSSLTETVHDLREAEVRDKKHLAQLENSNSEKDTFYSILAHDLKSPFNSLLGFTGILADDMQHMGSEEVNRIISTIHRSAQGLYHLVESLLEWSRSQRGMTPFEPVTLELHQQSSQVIHHLSGMVAAKSISIRQDIPAGLTVFADRHMLETIMRNLLMNALKFTPDGGEVVLAALPENEGMVLVTVSDNGIGMNPEQVSTAFNPYAHHIRKGTSGEPGSGLGLVICRDFVNRQGGSISLESTEGKGSTFRFTLPAWRT